MRLVNTAVESVAAADSRSPPPDAGGAARTSQNHLRGGRQGLTPALSGDFKADAGTAYTFR